MTDPTTPAVKRKRRTKAEMLLLHEAKKAFEQARDMLRDVKAGKVPAPALPRRPRGRPAKQAGATVPMAELHPVVDAAVDKLAASKSLRQVQQARQAETDALRVAAAQNRRADEAVASATLLAREAHSAHLVGHASEVIARAMQQPLADLQTIDAAELGRLIGRSTKSVSVDSVRRPHTLPPRFVVPSTRKLRWRVVDVREWMDALAEIEADRRAAQVEFSRRVNAGPVYGGRGLHLGTVDMGAAATKRMMERRALAAKADPTKGQA